MEQIDARGYVWIKTWHVLPLSKTKLLNEMIYSLNNKFIRFGQIPSSVFFLRTYAGLFGVEKKALYWYLLKVNKFVKLDFWLQCMH